MENAVAFGILKAVIFLSVVYVGVHGVYLVCLLVADYFHVRDMKKWRASVLKSLD
jgi:hypothetical protein